MEAEDVTHSDLLVSQAKQKGERKRVNQVSLIHTATVDIKQSETAPVAFSGCQHVFLSIQSTFVLGLELLD